MVQPHRVAAPLAGMPGDAPFTAVRQAFLDLRPAAIAELLTGIATGLVQGRRPAGARPYRHVNGFTKLVVAEYPACGARLTLHYWPAGGDGRHESRPHDHRFAFSSILLTGSQSFVELAEAPEAPDADPWRCYAYRPYLTGRFARLRLRGDVRLRQVCTVTREPLDGHYTTSSSVVHQAVTDRASACATLVLRGPRERRSSHVFYRPGETARRGSLQVGRAVSGDDLARQLTDVAVLVAGA